MRRRHLLCYDIRDPGRLRRVHRLAREWGHALQYSVFVCDLTAAERIQLVDALAAVADADVDSVTLFDLGQLDGAAGVDPVAQIGSVREVFRGGPTVV
ncbi:MAG TPA: CRISPR-associated endonuclease Cas2 [Miltoncostaeaceae bacterium]|nr:CRISPR-associated endonuclease Cas2 [Miltoncostaeaceae bacterium]